MLTTPKIKRILKTIPDFEDEKTHELFLLSKKINAQGYINKSQGMQILKWKSPRPLKHYDKNSNEDFVSITRFAFTQKNERFKIHSLTALYGVKFPAASALLMFYNPKKYPIIDIRVWQQLYKLKLLSENPKGQSFTLAQWENYLMIIRQLAKENKLSARQVEKRLFDYDRKTRKGNLYF